MENSLLIHTCCADCLLNALTNLESRGVINSKTNLVSLFYNPNIHPRAEFYERLNAVKKILPQLKEKWDIRLVIPDYSPKEYIKKILEKGSRERCELCWELRLEHAFEYAKENGFEKFTTTLLTSHYQDRDILEGIAKKIGAKYKIEFLNLDDSSNKVHSGFYKQNYCGCCFSLTEKMVSS